MVPASAALCCVMVLMFDVHLTQLGTVKRDLSQKPETHTAA